MRGPNKGNGGNRDHCDLKLGRFNDHVRRGDFGRDKDEQEAGKRQDRSQDGELPRHADDSTQWRGYADTKILASSQ